ncbi:MAG: hypothetical protein JRI76_02750 [Deltaproteobacteria bacterium]|nr:hypothetical protein [Deltaproteobacteria bacterium]MBW1955279.1 hypothetical protein [Deltaproteobacteria bacterium]MBW2040930.1 hypothetical protein [Deltaproteobacteria bacterium]MBW2130974.1 hypothetical protein [Deltaproteobacteria bacterium]
MIYIGNFLYLSGEEKAEEAQRRHGEFSLFVEATTIEKAIHRFREKISEIHESGGFFGAPPVSRALLGNRQMRVTTAGA